MVKDAYIILKKYPKEETFCLCDQLKRAVISVPSNIAEGMSRVAPKEQMHFLQIAYGSLMEVLCQFGISSDLGYITDVEYERLRLQIETIAKMLNALHASLNKKLSDSHKF